MAGVCVCLCVCVSVCVRVRVGANACVLFFSGVHLCVFSCLTSRSFAPVAVINALWIIFDMFSPPIPPTLYPPHSSPPTLMQLPHVSHACHHNATQACPPRSLKRVPIHYHFKLFHQTPHQALPSNTRPHLNSHTGTVARAPPPPPSSTPFSTCFYAPNHRQAYSSSCVTQPRCCTL